MTKKGRPTKKLPLKPDLGTKELIKKRLHDLTIEALDLCFKRGLISPDEHRAGLKLRFLYNQKFGSPSISSPELTDCKGRNIPKFVDPSVFQEYMQLYAEVLNGLDYINSRKLVTDVCIFDMPPSFLTDKASVRTSLEYKRFLEGMKLVCSLLEHMAPAKLN